MKKSTKVVLSIIVIGLGCLVAAAVEELAGAGDTIPHVVSLGIVAYIWVVI